MAHLQPWRRQPDLRGDVVPGHAEADAVRPCTEAICIDGRPRIVLRVWVGIVVGFVLERAVSMLETC